MKLSWFLDNTWVKATAWVAAIEWLNTLTSNYHSLYNAQIWDVIGSVSGAVDWIMDMTSVSWILASNPLLETVASGATWLWAWMLSNNILKDFGLDSWEWNTWWTKNLIRYWINWVSTLWAFWAWSAALPYILWGSAVYWAWKHWWRYSKSVAKRVGWTAWWATWWVAKWAVVWWWNSIKAWVKWEQKLNPKI